MPLLLVHPGIEGQAGRLHGFDGQRHGASSARSTRNASTQSSAATAVITVVPLISASPSLGAKRMGLRPAASSASAAGMRRPCEFRLAHAHQHARDVGGGHQVARRAHRAVARHHRRDAAVQQRGQRVHQFRAHGGSAGRECGQAQQHGRAHHIVRERLPGGAGELAHQVVLQQLHLFGRERDAHVAAHAGIDAVDALAAREQLFQPRAALARCGRGRAGDDDFGAAVGHADYVLKGERAGAQFHAVQAWASYSMVNSCRVSQSWLPTASFTATAMA